MHMLFMGTNTSWAKYVELERSELRPWGSLMTKLQPTELDIFRNGYQKYY